MVETHSQPMSFAIVVDGVVLAVIVIHQRVDDGKIKQVVVVVVIVVRFYCLSHLVAVLVVVEADFAPSVIDR